MQKKLGVPDDAHWALVTLTTQASPDDVIAVVASYDSSLRYGAQTPFSDQLSDYWVGGQWKVDATHDTLSAIGNGGSRATDALLTLHYNDGRDKYEVKKRIKPGEQLWLNFGDLIHNQIPDWKGRTMPPTLKSGTYDIADLDAGMGGHLFEGKLTLDKTYGHLAYGCVTCCVDSPYLLAQPTNVVINGVQQVDAWGDNSCTGNQDNLNSYYIPGTWWSAAPSIAQMTVRQAKGMSVGTTTGYANGTIRTQARTTCPFAQRTAANTVNAAPCPSTVTVDQITPKSLPDHDQPTWLTGVGILARMKVGPIGTDYTNAVLVETVTPTSDSCPSNIQQYTSFPTKTAADNSTFTVGSSASWEGTNFPSVSNEFYDSHRTLVNINVLGLTSVQSCVAKATQTYTCNGVTIGTFTLTNTYTRGTVNGQAVTNITTTKQ